jgi:hypothetical protein
MELDKLLVDTAAKIGKLEKRFQMLWDLPSLSDDIVDTAGEGSIYVHGHIDQISAIGIDS